MSQNNLTLLMFCLVTGLVTVLAATLLVLVVKSHRTNLSLMQNLLKQQLTENQRLRNLILSPDLQTLAGLNYATLPSTEQPVTGSDPIDVTDFGEAINFEEELARKGYQSGDIGDLESLGWARPIIKRGDGDPIAFDAS